MDFHIKFVDLSIEFYTNYIFTALMANNKINLDLEVKELSVFVLYTSYGPSLFLPCNCIATYYSINQKF